MRKPGTVTWPAIRLYAESDAGLELLERTSTDSRTRVGRKGLDVALHLQRTPRSSRGSGQARETGGLAWVGAGRLELPISCPQSRRASHYATPRGATDILEDSRRITFGGYAGVAQW